MDSVPEKISFPQTEEEILSLWKKIDAFKTSVKRSEGLPEYNFYDGPPFATGLPHYGHILAGTIKDTVTRYAHQTGHHVERRFGWDCHGLPIEFEIDKELGIKTRDDVLKLGIPKYNAACRNIVMRYSSEWEKIVTRLGRWIDFQNDYKTMDKNFMESVWWVFKQMHEKGLVYKGFKVMPYSTGCTTPLSNFEVGLAYKEVQDPAVTVAFPLEEDPETSFVAWTTTPWTLPSNLALCVNPDFTYVKVFHKEHKKKYILSEGRLVELFKDPSEYTVEATFKGSDLKGKTYVPLFNFFSKEKSKGAFRVLTDGYVTNEAGTGIVHQAPAFGEDDFRVCSEAGIITKGEEIVCPVDDNGRFTSQVAPFVGQYVKEADPEIITHLKNNGRLVKRSTLTHSYPFCWRSDTPLIYRAVPSWFVAVEKVKDRLVKNNQQTYWVPDYVKEKRFHNWLQDARDWCVSRNRYWGTPIPVWASADGEEIVVIGSVEELERLSGKKIDDLHRESIDDITIPSTKGKGNLKRIDEVFDCWFESGSMPYAQLHYPFENKERFENGFPAHFIAEGIDQTRGWFYTLMVISTILFDQPPFKNLIVNGLVLASDGKKMSKRLKNYPDPIKVVNDCGADALRLYLINSPVVRAENLKFQEKGVKDIVKDVFLPWFNAYRFFVEAVFKFNKSSKSGQFQPNKKVALGSTNIFDKWILAATNSLIAFVRQEMSAYRLYTVLPQLVKFIDQLTNWYVRLNRRRLKGAGSEEDTRAALSTMFEVLLTTARTMSPFTPFLVEYFYQNLRKLLPENEREDSIHYLPFPEVDQSALNPEVERAINRMQAIIQLGRAARDRRATPVKFPLNKVTNYTRDPQFKKDVESLKSYVLEELNVRDFEVSLDESCIVTKATLTNETGKKLRSDFGKVKTALAALKHEDLVNFRNIGTVELAGHTLTQENIVITREFTGDKKKFEAAWDENDVIIVLDLEADESLKQEGLAREFANRVQKLRKKAGIHPSDPIEVFYGVDPKSSLAAAIKGQSAFVSTILGVPFAPLDKKPHYSGAIQSTQADVAGTALSLTLSPLMYAVDVAGLEKRFQDAQFALDIAGYLATRDYNRVKQLGANVSFVLNDKQVTLQHGKDFFDSVQQRVTVLGN